MSIKHPIIAVTGSSGAGTSVARDAFEYMFRKSGLKAAVIEGDCFHKYDRIEMDRLCSEAEREGRNLTHFGPEGNLFEELEAVFKEYSETGNGKRRFYIHNEKEASQHGSLPGTLTPWEALEADTSRLYVRIVSLAIQEGKEEEFKRIYSEEIIPALLSTKGCKYAYLTQSVQDKDGFISVTIWDSKYDADIYESSGKFDSLVEKVSHTFSQFYRWKMALEKDYDANIKTSEDMKVEKYNLVTGKGFK